jgi:16S rRNA (guanine1207-N2)-methyltransferase
MQDQDAYYRYLQQQVTVRGRVYAVCARAVLGQWRERAASSMLLAEHVRLSPQAQVLHLHCGPGLAGVLAAERAPDGHVTMLDSYATATEAACRTLQANSVANAEVMLSDSARAVCERSFDTVLALLPKGRATWEQTALDAASVLRCGGDLYLAGPNKAGIKTAAKFIATVFGNVNVLAYRGGCRVVRAEKRGPITVPPSDYYGWRPVTAQLNRAQIRYVTKPGLFSWERLDDGTRLLIEALGEHPVGADDHVLDVGCGTGVLTVVAARQAHRGTVTAVDVDCRAIEATRRTLALNKVANAEVLISDCGQAVQDRTFSAVVTNPPFHQEQATTYAVARQIVRDAAGLLRRRGELYLVANSFLKYRPTIEDAFGNVEVLRRTNRFTVWHAVKR